MGALLVRGQGSIVVGGVDEPLRPQAKLEGSNFELGGTIMRFGDPGASRGTSVRIVRSQMALRAKERRLPGTQRPGYATRPVRVMAEAYELADDRNYPE